MDNASPVSKVIVCATSYADASYVISLGATLAHLANANLSGVMIEDEMLEPCSRARSSRLLTAFGMPLESPTTKSFQQLLSADAKAFEAALERAAHAALRDWTFYRSQGDFAEKSLALSRHNGIVLIGHRKLHSFASSLIFICSAESNCVQTMHHTIAMAAKLNATITPVSIVPENKRAAVNAETLLNLCNAAQVRVEPIRMVSSQKAAFDFINRSTALAVIVDAASESIKTVKDLRQLRLAARCPIILSGQSRHSLAVEGTDEKQTNG